MYGSMIRTDESTWEIATLCNGETSKLMAQVGPWQYNWAVATLEEDSISSWDQYPRPCGSICGLHSTERALCRLRHRCPQDA